MELIRLGDDERVAALYSSDFVLHYPGRNPLAGTYTNVGQFMARLGRRRSVDLRFFGPTVTFTVNQPADRGVRVLGVGTP